MGILDLFAPSPEYCPAPETLPEAGELLDDLLQPPPPPPDPAPSREGLRAAIVAAAAAIAESFREDDECENCERCMAVTMGSEFIRSYGDIDTQVNGYEYQHYVVNWFVHDPVGRYIMEWQVGGVRFDGLDNKQGTKLAIRAIPRSEYDPGSVHYCYLIETKYGYRSWFRYNSDGVIEPTVPEFLAQKLGEDLGRQMPVVAGMTPNVGLVWIFSDEITKDFFETRISRSVPTVYYPYQASRG